MKQERQGKLEGLTVEDKRKRWRVAPKRLFWKIAAAVSGGRMPFRRRLSIALRPVPKDQQLLFHIPFAVAERALGKAAIIDADPRRINHWIVSEARSDDGIQSPRDYFLVSGNWQPLVQPISESPLDREVRELIVAKGSPRQTESFASLMARLRHEGAFEHNGVALASERDIERYLVYHAALIDSIRANGVVRRADLAALGTRHARPGSNGRLLESVETDAGVAIGPAGRLFRYRGGFHRTAAARELGLKSMPVQVKLVHVTWLRRTVRELGLAPHEALAEGLKRLSLH